MRGTSPNRQSRAGLSSQRPWKFSLCLFGRAGVGLSLHLISLQPPNHTTGKTGNQGRFKVCTKIKARKRSNWGNPPFPDLPIAVPLNTQCLYKMHTCLRDACVFWALGQVTINSSLGFQALRTHKSTCKININPSSSYHGKCPTLSKST